jgi:outer membrane protein
MVRNRLFLSLLCFFALAFFAMPAHAQTPTIAIVDVEKILAESKAAQSLQKQLQAKKEGFQKEFTGKEKELKAAETSLLAEREKISAEEFAKQRKAFEEKIIETRKLFAKRRNALDDGLGKAMNQLRKAIMESAAAIADEKKFDIVLTRESVLIAEKSLDITQDVLTALDARMADIKLQVE